MKVIKVPLKLLLPSLRETIVTIDGRAINNRESYTEKKQWTMQWTKPIQKARQKIRI